ncbi:MAG: alkaline phosphatase family protein [Bacteroidetes bacterium]|nr:alkaline phosphatase family protein [Bacteroidota bacterium]
MKTKSLYALLSLCVVLNAYSQKQKKIEGTKNSTPKLIVGIVVDQMRNDYIYRFWNRYGNGGFKRLINTGFYFKNVHYNYTPTYTGPGHCSIYTGSTPRTHGIIGNEWFVKQNFTEQYCTGDTLVQSVGGFGKTGQMSPHNQLCTTIGDELKISSNGKAKVFGVALKDRSSILPAGHAADAAFWLDEATGKFISSTWYLNELPQWLVEFNNKDYASAYLKKEWNTLYPIETYTNSLPDDNSYEGTPSKKNKPVFPYTYNKFIETKNFGIICSTPFGNSFTKDLAIALLNNEKLGKDNVCDLLCLSFSSTDYIAHSYGPRAVETEDVYLRLDKDLEELLLTLDTEVGKDNYTIFLTADHGGADVPKHLQDNKIPAGNIKHKQIKSAIKAFCFKNYGDSTLLLNISNEQVFLNETKLSLLKLDKDVVEQQLCDFIITQKGIAEAYPSKVMRNQGFQERDYRYLLQNGYHHKLSGSIVYLYEPAWMSFPEKGATHGSAYNYDTHVPIILYGNGIKKGQSTTYSTITQIAPTICNLIQINAPNGCTASPLNKAIK